METKIPYNINDLSQKGIMNLFQGKEISLFGFKIPKIVDSLNVELTDIKFSERRTDLVFLLEDDSLLHLEFQTDYKQTDITRFLSYDAMLHEKHKFRKVNTVVIFAAGVKPRNFQLQFETLHYRPHVVFLEELNGDDILRQLEIKVENKISLNDGEIIHLLFNFFMKSGILETERATRLIKVASTIEDDEVRNRAIATTYGLAGKFLNPEQMTKLDEVFKLTDPLVALVKREAAKEVSREALETAKKLLNMNLTLEQIAEATNLSVSELEQLEV